MQNIFIIVIIINFIILSSKLFINFHTEWAHWFDHCSSEDVNPREHKQWIKHRPGELIHSLGNMGQVTRLVFISLVLLY